MPLALAASVVLASQLLDRRTMQCRFRGERIEVCWAVNLLCHIGALEALESFSN